jgi:hypothetical protein
MRIEFELKPDELLDLMFAMNQLGVIKQDEPVREDAEEECDEAEEEITDSAFDKQWARARKIAGLEPSIDAPSKKNGFYISPEKLADIDVYMRVAGELGDFGPRFFRDKWQEIKAMYNTYRDEGVPGRKVETTTTPDQ